MTVRSLIALGLTALFLGSCGKGSQDAKLESQIKRRVELVEDSTIFTLFALLNVAGYDDENRETGMHPVRRTIRAQLDTLVSPEFRTRLRDFYDLHRAHASPWTYGVVAKASSGPPDFAPDSVWTNDLAGRGEFAGMEKMHAFLREFHRKVPVEQLYAGVGKDYTEYIRDYRNAVRREVTAALSYARIRDVSELTGFGEVEHCVVVPNLLESYDRATSFILRDTLYSVEGPREKLGYNPHEFIHAVTNPAVYDSRLSTQSEKARPILEALRMTGAEANFRSPAALLDESLVRAVTLRYPWARASEEERATLESHMMEEYRAGYILERFFWEQLDGYEKSALPLRQFYPAMLESLDVLQEIRRWQAEIAPSGSSGAAPESTAREAR